MKKLYKYKRLELLDEDEIKEIPDENVIFHDGVLFIFCSCGMDKDCEAHRIFIDPQYDEAISLKDIAIKYPLVDKVIYEKGLEGYVYSYGNHKYGEWELVGETVGYA